MEKKAMSDRKCPYCDGQGGRQEREGPHIVLAVCYACNNTGRVGKGRYQQYRRQSLADLLGQAMVADLKRALNESPDGEGWSFHAAENGMTPHNYTIVKEIGYSDLALKRLLALDELILDDLTDRLVQDDPAKTVLHKRYTEDDFPSWEPWVAKVLLRLLYPPEPACPACGPPAATLVVVRDDVVDCDAWRDEEIPF